MNFQKMKRQAAIHSVGSTINICFQAGCEKRLRIAKSGLNANLGAQIRILMSRGSCGGLSGEMALSSGMSENVEENDLRSAVKGGG